MKEVVDFIGFMIANVLVSGIILVFGAFVIYKLGKGILNWMDSLDDEEGG